MTQRKSEDDMPDQWAEANAQVIDAFRANNGVVGGPFEGKRVILLHHAGRTTGRDRVTPLVAASDGNAYLVCGTAGGAPHDPAWIANIEAGPGQTTIEVGEQGLQAKTTVVHPTAPEWQRLYAIWSAYWPDSRKYETRTSRRFPIIRLEPLT
jgi:deazaflavin-dependent oxidoreductase (nitroreductase family)